MIYYAVEERVQGSSCIFEVIKTKVVLDKTISRQVEWSTTDRTDADSYARAHREIAKRDLYNVKY